MTEEGLDDPEVSAARQEVRRERMAERVGRDAPAEPRRERTAPDELPDRLARERPAPGAEENEGARPPPEEPGPAMRQVRLECGARGASERYDALFSAL